MKAAMEKAATPPAHEQREPRRDRAFPAVGLPRDPRELLADIAEAMRAEYERIVESD